MTMKKLISIVLAVAAILTMATTAFAAPPANLISEDEAKAIALEHAGFSAEEVKFTKVQLDFDDGRYEYEIEFNVGYEKEYDYTVNAENGAILEFDLDIDRPDGFEFFMIIEWFRSFLAYLFGKA